MRIPPEKEDLEQIDAILLAVMCKKLARDPATEPKTAEKAQKMMEEWIAIQDRKMPPSPTVKDYDKMEADIAELKARMVDFLLPYVRASFRPVR